MGVLVCVVFFGFLACGVYSRFRVMARKRYTTQQRGAPDLNRFSEGPDHPRDHRA